MTNNTPILEFRNLTKSYPKQGGTLTVLDGLQRSIHSGEFITLLGPSGCGKSTLFNLILGSQSPTKGEVLLDGNPVIQPGPDRGVVYQKYGLFDHLTVLENVMLGGTVKRPVMAKWLSSLHRKAIQEDIDRAHEYLDRVRLGDAANKYPHELSGGMRQRVAIAQALFTQPRILLMDEPFGALDAGTRHDAQLFLIELWEKFGFTVIFVTHSLEEAVYLGTRTLVLSQHYEHPDGPHRTDNGAKFVMDHDLTPYVERRHAISHEQYVSKFTKLLDRITEEGMDPKVRQHVSEFRTGQPSDDDVLAWTDEDHLSTDGDIMKDEETLLNGRVQLALLLNKKNISIAGLVLAMFLLFISTIVGCYATNGFWSGDTSSCRFQGRTADFGVNVEKECRIAGRGIMCSPIDKGSLLSKN